MKKNFLSFITLMLCTLYAIKAQNVQYLPLYDASTFSAKNIDTDLPVGYTAGAVNVSPTGGVSYSIPITLPPGTKGVVPSVSVGYNSQGGNGMMGMGWNISGLSAISRTGTNMYLDGKVSPVKLNYEDFFVLDGNRLEWDAATNSYKTKMETFAKITSFGNSADSPDWFKVESKNGTTYEYGHTVSSKFQNDESIVRTISWQLNKMYDQYGNYVEYIYEMNGREMRIKEIKYTGNAAANISPYNKIMFNYQDRTDKTTLYVGGAAIASNSLLTEIIVTTEGDVQVRKYNFEYGYDDIHSFLIEVKEYGSDNTKLNATIFKYNNSTINMEIVNSQGFIGEIIGTGDFNGDGFRDVLTAETFTYYENKFVRKIRVYRKNRNDNLFTLSFTKEFLSTEFYYYLPIAEKNQHSNITTMDANGDGRDEIILIKILTTTSGAVDISKASFKIFEPNEDATNFVTALSGDSRDFRAALRSDNNCWDALPQANNKLKDWLHIGDFDGDGKSDFLAILNPCAHVSNVIKAIIFTPENIYVEPHRYPFYLVNIPVGNGASDWIAADKITVLDFDGDGKTDIMITKQTSSFSRKVYALRPITINTPPYLEYYADEIHAYSVPSTTSKETDFQVGDFNGDGKSDILGFNKARSSWFLYRSNGKTFFKDHTTPFSTDYNTDELPYFSKYDTKSKYSKFEIADFNGDGLSDVLLTKITFSYMANRWEGLTKRATISHTIYFSDGNNFIVKNFTDNRAITDVDLANFYHIGKQFRLNQTVSDFNGDGKADILSLCSYIKYDAGWIEYGYPSLVSFNPSVKSGSLEKIANGFNQVTEIGYKYLTEGNSVYTKNLTSSYPFNVIDAPLKVVSWLSIPNGIGGTNQTTYKYENAKLHRAGLGFLGFSKFEATNLSLFNAGPPLIIQGTRSITEFEIVATTPTLQDPTPKYATGVKKQTVRNYSNDPSVNDALLSETINTNSIRINGTRYWQKIDATSSTNGLTGATANSTYQYDDYGNVTQEITNINNAETVTSTKTFSGTYGTTVPAHPETVTVQKKRNNIPFPTEEASILVYNSKGEVTNKTDKSRELGVDVQTLTTSYFYNPTMGLLSGRAMYSNGIAPRYESFGYDTKGRFTTNITNTLGQVASKTYDARWGTVLTETDITGLTTTYTYDGFGRVINTLTPQGHNIGKQYLWSYGGQYLPVKCYDIVTSVPGKPSSWDIYDVLGRKTVETHENYGDKDHRWVYTYTIIEYDAKGNVSKKSTPVNGTDWGTDIEYTTLQYDGFNRLTSEMTSVGSTNYAYSYNKSGNSTVTVTNPAGQVASKTTDATGKVISTTDTGGTLTFDYDNRGNQTNVKMNGTVITSMAYDTKGHQKSLTDQNSGMTEYNYDNYGQLKWQKDASGSEYTMKYDGLGRLTTRTGAEGTTTNEYVTNGNGLNQIKKITGFNGHLEEYVYDNWHRVVTATETIEGTDYAKNFTYNAYNDLETTTYPSGLIIKNNYSPDGYLYKVEQVETVNQITDGQALFDGTKGTMSGMGKWRNYKLGNGIESNITYNNWGMPTNYQAGNAQDLTLDWDLPTGNLTSRLDKGKGEVFHYDKLNRLIAARTDAGQPIQSDYFENGNPRTKSDVGTFIYDQFKTNAVVKVVDGASPSPISRSPQDIIYTTFHRAEKITEGSYEMTFLYASDYERRKTILSQDQTEIETRLYMGDYEVMTKKDIVTQIHYISGGDGICSIIVIDAASGKPKYYFPYTDHLGSILTVTDINGDIVAEQNFDAWGRKRNTDTWEYTNVQTVPDWLYRGFTGHEHLPEFGLINMNARLYDPALGRMLSPDNYVGSGGSQGFNRYSYAGNNPLKFVDPDGNFFFSTFLGPAGAVIDYACWSATINLGMQLISGKGQINWADVGGAFVGGLISGGLGTAAPSFVNASLANKYIGKALSTSVNAGISALGGQLVSDLLDDKKINTSSSVYFSRFKNAAIFAGATSLAVSAYDYATWDRFSPDEKIDIIKTKFGIVPNSNIPIDYDPSITVETDGNLYGITDNKGIHMSKLGLQNRANAYKTFMHERGHWWDNDFFKSEHGTSVKTIETMAHRNSLLIVRPNVPYRYIQQSLKSMNTLYWIEDSLIPKNIPRASHILFNILR